MVTRQLFDLSSLYAVNALMSSEMQRDRHGYSSVGDAILRECAWELKCLESLVESVILCDGLFLPSKPPEDSLCAPMRQLLSERSIRILPYEWKTERECLGRFAEWLSAEADTREVLASLVGRLSKDLCRRRDQLEVYTGRFALTPYCDTLTREQIVRHQIEAEVHAGDGERGATSHAYYLKALYYDHVARAKGLSYCPHPARIPMLLFMGWRVEDTQCRPVARTFDRIESFASEVGDGSLQRTILPPLFTYVLRSAKRRDDILARAVELRHSKPCVHFRGRMRQQAMSLEEGSGGVDLAAYGRSVGRMLENLGRELGLEDSEVTSDVWLFRVPVGVPRILYRQYFVGSQKHFSWLKEVATTYVDTTDISGILGHLFDGG